MRGGAGGGWTCRCTDTRTKECSLNVSVMMQVAEMLCQHLSLLDSENGSLKKKQRREKGLLRKKGGRDGWTDREWLKDCWTTQRMKKELKNEMRDGRTFVLSVVLWSSLCTYRLSQPSVATLCSLFSPSHKKKIFLFSKFLLFYYLKTVVIMMMLLMTMSILLIL